MSSASNFALWSDGVVTGTVVPGDQRGRQLGFPTANLALAPCDTHPRDGVYAGSVTCGDVVSHPAAISVGRRNTFYGDGIRLLEAHLLDFSGDCTARSPRSSWSSSSDHNDASVPSMPCCINSNATWHARARSCRLVRLQLLRRGRTHETRSPHRTRLGSLTTAAKTLRGRSTTDDFPRSFSFRASDATSGVPVASSSRRAWVSSWCGVRRRGRLHPR